MLINAVCRALGKSENLLPRSHQIMIFWAGLRGAVAFALSSGLVGESAPAMRTTILAVVVLTVLIFGGTTNRMLQLLDIRTGVVEPDDSDSDDEDQGAESSGGYRRLRSRSQDRGGESLLVDVTDDEDPSHSRKLSGRRRRSISSNNAMEVSIGGLLSGPLGDPIPEPAEPHWFVSFDEKWLKPLFTKRHIQARNQTLAEYWREKRRRMERANRNMLSGIRNMSFGQASAGSDDYYSEYDDDALTLNTVHANNPPSYYYSHQNTSSSGTSSQKLVVGSGRVFGRPPPAGNPDRDDRSS